MRRALAVAALAVVAGCGDRGTDGDRARPAATRAATGEHPGLKVWVAQGCGSCHTMKAAGSTGPIGPSFDDPEQTPDIRDRGYVTASIIDPNAQAASGRHGGGMPEDYGKRIGERELEDLVDFIVTSAGR